MLVDFALTVVQHAKHGMSVSMAFMSPHVKGLEGTREERERMFDERARAQQAELARRRATASAKTLTPVSHLSANQTFLICIQTHREASLISIYLFEESSSVA